MSNPYFYSPLKMEIDLRDLPNLRSIMSGALIYNGMDMYAGETKNRQLSHSSSPELLTGF